MNAGPVADIPAAGSDAPSARAVRSLLATVRRRLWRDRFVEATRHALWASAALVTTATALHLALGQPGLAITLAVAGAAWLVALARAAVKRPSVAESALFADRFLGGESAYSTWLETDVADAGVPHTPALQRLAHWTDAAAPTSRAALAALHTPSRLGRPLAAAGVCAAVAALVMALPDVARDSTAEAERAARDRASPAEALAIDDDVLARELEDELAASARSSVGPDDPVRGSMRRDEGTEPTDSAAPSTGTSAATPLALRDEVRPSTADASGAAVRDGDSPAGTSQAEPADQGAAGVAAARTPGSGREAGTTRDDLAATGGTPVLAGALTVRRRDIIRPGEEAARQADMTQAGIYEGEAASASGDPAAARTIAPARPPAARRDTALSPAEAAYVAAWGQAMNATPAVRR
jgi:hypothetical protein